MRRAKTVTEENLKEELATPKEQTGKKTWAAAQDRRFLLSQPKLNW
jgi:hypothetical protein